MYKNGFIKVEAASPKIIVGNIKHNKNEVLDFLNKSKSSILVFPELTLTGYSLSDLFFQNSTIKESLKALKEIVETNKFKGLFVVGLPLEIDNVLYNVACLIYKNEILGVIPKYYLPNNQEYNEKRWFESGFSYNKKTINLFNKEVPFGPIIFKDESKDIKIGVEICQDMWQLNPPSNLLVENGANIILNLSASTELIEKDDLRKRVVLETSRRQLSAYVYTTTGMYESSAEALFSSQKIIGSLGNLLIEDRNINYNKSSIIADININEINFRRRQDSNYRTSYNNGDVQIVNFNLESNLNYEFSLDLTKTPFHLSDNNLLKTFEILTASLVKKLTTLPIDNQKIILGLSGGLDSAHALLVAYNAIKNMNLSLDNLKPIIMPTKESSKESMNDAVKLCEGLNLKYEIINIQEEVDLHLKMLNHNNKKDTTYENVQARIRTLVLMNLANKYGGLVLGTGDLSEIALGFMTYNGDQMSMYAINSGLPKTTIQQLTTYYANNTFKEIKDVLLNIVNKKISPELIKDQNTEDIIGSYLINDFILYNHLYSGLEKDELIFVLNHTFKLKEEKSIKYVNRFLNRFYSQAFKRATLPEGPKIFDISLSPRTNFKLPSDIYKEVK